MLHDFFLCTLVCGFGCIPFKVQLLQQNGILAVQSRWSTLTRSTTHHDPPTQYTKPSPSLFLSRSPQNQWNTYMLPKKYPGSYPILFFSNKYPQNQALCPYTAPVTDECYEKPFLFKAVLWSIDLALTLFFFFIPANNSKIRGERCRGVETDEAGLGSRIRKPEPQTAFWGKKKTPTHRNCMRHVRQASRYVSFRTYSLNYFGTRRTKEFSPGDRD